MKRRTIDAAELSFLREQVERRFRSEGGAELEWKSYLPRYDDLHERIRRRIHGRSDAAISPNILRRLFWDSKDLEQAAFNVVYLNALALYISEGVSDYRGLHTASTGQGDGTDQVVTRSKHDPECAEHVTTHAVEASMVDEVGIDGSSADRSTRLPDIRPLGTERPYAHPVEWISTPPTARDVAPDGVPAHTETRSAHSSFLVFARPFLVAAIYSAVASFVFAMLFSELSGYERLTREALRELMPPIFGTPVFAHLSMGFVLAFLTRWLFRSPTPQYFAGRFVLLSPVLFVATYFGRHLFVRNGWMARGSGSPAFFGTPDLETLAITLAFMLWIVLFLGTMKSRRPFTNRSPLFRATIITLACGTVFFTISIAHTILVSHGYLDVEGHFIAPTILNFKFPHPERLPLICFMIFIQTYLTLKFFAEQAPQAHPSVRERWSAQQSDLTLPRS